MSQQWPDPGGYWREPESQEWQAGRQGLGGFQPPPGYQSGAWPSAWQAQPAQGFPPQAYPYAPPGSTDPGPTTGSVVSALVVAVITMLICSGTNIIGVVLACIALGKNDNPSEAAKLTRFAWISNWIHIGLIGIIAAFIITLIVVSA